MLRRLITKLIFWYVQSSKTEWIANLLSRKERKEGIWMEPETEDLFGDRWGNR